MLDDISPLDLEEDEEIIMVAAEDDEESLSEAESEGEIPTISVKACRCDACTAPSDLGTCWDCDNPKCSGRCKA